MQYRREIDGLRTIAVIPVILFHAGLSLFSGGFVGVDVFFVISGYLITSIIINDIEQDQFSILRFYERRIRRILPALYFVMLISTLFAWFLMLPDQLENYGQSMVATTAFSNNLLLAMTTGYWDVLTELKPLVHTWSLAVEEQFYVVFPLLMLIIWKGPRWRVVTITVVLAVLSLAAAEWGLRHLAEGHFYLPHSRAWELLAGSLCAFALFGKAPTRNDPAALLGLALIAFAIFAYDEATPFPSLYGLAPVVGTALIILFATQDSWVGRVLSLRPMVGIGLLSYSAYLWHQPLFAYLRIFMKDRPEPWLLASMTPVVLFLSWLSWRFVEKPFRDRNLIKAPLLYGMAAFFSAVMIGLGLLFHFSHGFPERVYPASLANADDMYISYNEGAFRHKLDAFETDKPVKLLVIGNSFGRDIVNMVKETYGQDRIEIIYRDDLDACVAGQARDAKFGALVAGANVIIINELLPEEAKCMGTNFDWAKRNDKQIFHFGTKNFGTNINWLMRVPDQADRALLTNHIDPEVAKLDRWLAKTVPADHFVSVMGPLMVGDEILFTDEQGRLLTADTRHLTRHGAIYVGKKVLSDPRIKAALDPR